MNEGPLRWTRCVLIVIVVVAVAGFVASGLTTASSHKPAGASLAPVNLALASSVAASLFVYLRPSRIRFTVLRLTVATAMVTYSLVRPDGHLTIMRQPDVRLAVNVAVSVVAFVSISLSLVPALVWFSPSIAEGGARHRIAPVLLAGVLLSATSLVPAGGLAVGSPLIVVLASLCLEPLSYSRPSSRQPWLVIWLLGGAAAVVVIGLVTQRSTQPFTAIASLAFAVSVLLLVTTHLRTRIPQARTLSR